MIVVTGHLTIDPAQRAAVEAAIATLISATRVEEGNVDYRYGADLGKPDRINITEIWESDEAMTAHMGTQHLADFMAAVGPAISGSVEIVRHDIDSSTKLF